ncbi:sensor domain-containing diguanylate cyclase [Erythrobacter mangrovi]|uniref:diguanylate cyclase n=1 Tax=Erythrobacter mangrovi TaxID=2739433 RepID=A0A7D4B6Y3_9SPHN|nr:diguanylate cyclase [Erythrobacter mangrovi]QKG70723.1 diguanylate cyclase [Erythrobacter mangrovi]
MGVGTFRYLFGALLLALCMLPGMQAQAAGGANLGERCGITLDTLPTAQELSRISNWQCPARFDVQPDKAQIIRFDLSDRADRAQLRHAISRKADFERLIFVAEDMDGGQRTISKSFADGRQAYLERQFSLPLPEITEETRYLFAIMLGGREIMPLDYLRLEAQLPGSTPSERNALLLYALVIGILVMPILIDLGVFYVLRDRFSLLHAGMVGSTLIHLVTVSGLNLPFFTLSLPMARLLGVASFGAIVIGASLFTESFLEREHLSKRGRRVFYGHAFLVAIATALHAPQFHALGRFPADFFYITCLAGSPYFVWAIAKAWRDGSRSARFLAVGFAPLVVVGVIRTGSHLIPGMPTYDAGTLFLLGGALEVMATTLGVADRFLSLRRERDRMLDEAQALASLARRDPLTGALNRRAITEDFDGLVAEGYTACMLVDLDKFKSVNDEYGHATGDRVLQLAASALGEDPASKLVRMGGEEFLLLLHGDDACQRADARRRAITARVLAELDGLERPITASAGFLDFKPVAGEADLDFAMLYTRVDQLLYSAKCEGRNQTVCDTLQLFDAKREADGAVAA